MALEQRMQMLISEVTTSISTRLMEGFTIPTPRVQDALTGTETSGTNIESSLIVSIASTAEEQITPPVGIFRRERRQMRARELSSSCNGINILPRSDPEHECN